MNRCELGAEESVGSLNFFHLSLPPSILNIKNICFLVFTLLLAALVIFENCTLQSKVLCKMPGSQSTKAGRSTGGYETTMIFHIKFCKWCCHSWSATCTDGVTLLHWGTLKNVLRATTSWGCPSSELPAWHCSLRAGPEDTWGVSILLCKASRAALGTELVLGFCWAPWLLQPAAYSAPDTFHSSMCYWEAPKSLSLGDPEGLYRACIAWNERFLIRLHLLAPICISMLISDAFSSSISPLPFSLT